MAKLVKKKLSKKIKTEIKELYESGYTRNGIHLKLREEGKTVGNRPIQREIEKLKLKKEIQGLHKEAVSRKLKGKKIIKNWKQPTAEIYGVIMIKQTQQLISPRTGNILTETAVDIKYKILNKFDYDEFIQYLDDYQGILLGYYFYDTESGKELTEKEVKRWLHENS